MGGDDMIPCGHAKPVEGCHICWLVQTKPAYRRLWAGPIRLTLMGGTVRNPKACEHLGDKVPGQPCGSGLYQCLKFGDITSSMKACSGAARTCQTCECHPAASAAV